VSALVLMFLLNGTRVNLASVSYYDLLDSVRVPRMPHSTLTKNSGCSLDISVD